MRRRLMLVTLAALAAATGWIPRPPPPDMSAFATAGQHILDGRLALVYDGDWNQAGPVQLLLSRVLLLGGHGGAPAPWLIGLVDAGLLLVALTACARTVTDPARLWRRELLVGAAVLLWLASGAPWEGHPVELLIPLGWIAAAYLARRRRPAAAVGCLAVAVAIAPWAVLGLPALLAGARPARAALIAALGAGAGVLAYLPFVLTHHFHLLGHAWPVAPGSLVHRLDPARQHATWAFRAGQAVVASLGGAAVAWRYRGAPLAPVAAALVAVLLRILTDPLQMDYYWDGALCCAIALLARAPDRTRPAIGATLVAYGCWAAPALGHPLTGAALCVAATLCLLAVDRRATPRPRGPLFGEFALEVDAARVHPVRM